ncbi:MAG: DUF3179 domain-containing (seleno)protein [Nitrososphaeraceae archaeon]
MVRQLRRLLFQHHDRFDHSRFSILQSPYGADPYGDYYTNSEVLFPISNQDNRLGLKEIVIGLENNGQNKAYRLQDIEHNKIINDKISNNPIMLMSSFPFIVRAFDPIVDGQALQFKFNPYNNSFLDLQTGSEWNIEAQLQV